MINLKKIWQNKVFYIFIVLALVFLTPVMGRPAESERRAIAAAIGVDMSEYGIEISANILVPKGEADIISNLDTVSANGTNINSALYNLGVKLGKRVGLAHCEYVIFGADMFEEDVTKYLDFFIRTNNLTTNAVFIGTRGKAKDVMEASSNKNSPYNSSIKNMIVYNDDFLFTINMNIESFYDAYYGYEGVSVMGMFDAIPKEKEKTIQDGPQGKGQAEAVLSDGLSGDTAGGGEDTSEGVGVLEQGGAIGGANLSSMNAQNENESENIGGGGDDGSDGGGSDKEKVVSYQANMMVVKNGKKIRELNEQEVEFIKIYHLYIRTLFIELQDINTPEYKNASVTLEIFNKRARSNVHFINGIPMYKLNLRLNIKFDEINADEQTIDSLNEVSDMMLPNIYEKLIHKIELGFSEVIKNAKEYNTDIMGVYSLFNKIHTKKWNKYIDSLENKKEYLDGVVFELNIEADTKL